jgi:hypothetical protein
VDFEKSYGNVVMKYTNDHETESASFAESGRDLFSIFEIYK